MHNQLQLHCGLVNCNVFLYGPWKWVITTTCLSCNSEHYCLFVKVVNFIKMSSLAITGRGMRPDSDSRKLAGYSASRVRPQPVVGMSQATAESHMQQTFSKHHVNVTPGQGYTYAPSGTAGKSSTDPCVQRQESSVSASTDSSLPQPLTQPGVVSALDDSLLSGFEADQRYIGEGINSEIRHEAHRYKKGEKGVVAVPAQADDQDWPLDPNLTCPYCKVVFRRGQMREYRYHVDDCQ